MRVENDAKDAVVREFLTTVRLVILGKSDALLARLKATRPEKLMASEAAVGLLIGLVSLSPGKALAFAAFLPGATMVWIFLYAAVSNTAKEIRPALYPIFFGSSLFLAPAAVPILGPPLLPLLAFGWPFVLARLVAREKKESPGRVLFDLTLPLVILWAALQIVFMLVGKLISS